MNFGPLRLLIIQATPFCNLDCGYCYLPDRNNKSVIASRTLEHLFRQIFASSLHDGSFGLVWHAGEPLVLPISFYENALDILDRENLSDCKVINSIQTNGVLITQAWCDFFKRRGIDVGLSIDGPAFIHDKRRVTRAGKGTHARAARSVRMLQDNDIPFHVIAVITKDTLPHADEFFSFFAEYGVTRIGLNIEEVEGIHQHSSMSGSAAESEFSAFVRRLWVLNASNPQVHIREFRGAQARILSRKPALSTRIVPFQNLCVDYLGNFTTFSPELLGMRDVGGYESFLLGNVVVDRFEDVLKSKKLERMYQEIMGGVKLCSETCDYFELCGGGFPSNKYFENGTFVSAETMTCRLTRKRILDVVLAEIERHYESTPLSPMK